MTSIDFTEQEHQTATCSHCREPLGRIIDPIHKTWIVADLKEVEKIVGDSFYTKNLEDHFCGKIPIESVDYQTTHARYAGDCTYLDTHFHIETPDVYCPVHLPSVLAHADAVGEIISFGDDTSTCGAVADFNLMSCQSEPHAVQLALAHPWVANELAQRRLHKARQDANRRLTSSTKNLASVSSTAT